MRLTRYHRGRRYGYYFCASDGRLQFHSVAVFAGRRPALMTWEVRLNGRRGQHYFATLRAARAWARQHWRPWFLGFVPAPLRADNNPVLRAALMGDEASFDVWLDQVEEHGG